MTPTEQEIEFFASEEAKRIQELWEPKFGDWIYATDEVVTKSCVHLRPEGHTWVVVAARPESVNVYARSMGYPPPVKKRDAIWLPRQGQLQAMLEERGYRWEARVAPLKPQGIYASCAWNPERDIEGEGPTPSIALGRALIDVLKEE